ncbi:hypothetical protein JW859_13835 [bacterium]|nr:hypothetical protein [bacterium]
MNKAVETGWEPEADPEFGQRLIPYLLRRYRWLLAGCIVLGCVGFGIASLVTPAAYSTRGSLHVTKGSSTASMLNGLSLLSGNDAGLWDEVLIIKSREIGWPVIEELGLQAEIYDPACPDASWQRVLARFNRSPVAYTREQVYSRLAIRAVDVDENVLSKTTGWLSADAAGNWRFNGKRGSAGEAVAGSTYTFTPEFGAAHRAGNRYKVTILPDHLAWAKFSGRLSVSPAAVGSNIINVKFSHPNPVIAQQVTDKVIERYLDYTRTMTFGDFDLMLDFINTETESTTARLDSLMAELADYREEHQVYAEAAQGATAVQSMSELSLARADQRIQLRQIDNLLGLIRTRTPEEVNATIQAPATNLPLEQELTGQLATLVQNLDTARQTKTEAHPEVIGLEDQIGTVLSQIEDSLTTSRRNVELAIGGLDSNIYQLKSELESLPEASGKIAMLMGEIEAAQQVLALLKEQEAQTKLRRAGTSTEVRVLDAPPMPAKRDSPRLSRDLALGCAVGALVGVLLLMLVEATRNSFRSLRDLRTGLGLNLLAALPGPPNRRRWVLSETDNQLAQQLIRLLDTPDHALALVHLGKYPSYDLCWALSARVAGDERQALLIDADLLNAGLSRALKQPEVAGLLEAAADPARLGELAANLGESRAVLTPGQSGTATDGLTGLLAAAGEQFSRTLICLPAPSKWLARELWTGLGEVILTVPQSGATRDEIKAALAKLGEFGIGVRGVVVTNYSTARDPLGREELPQVSVTPAGRI